MKLFTIREDISVGIEVVLGNEMKIGQIDVGKSAVLDLEKTASHMVAMLKKDDPDVTVDGTRVMLDAADLVENEGRVRFIKERSRWDREAIVLVETPRAENGSIKLMSGKKVDSLTPDGKRVKWELAPFESAVGVYLIDQKNIVVEGQEPIPTGFLVHMFPGSRFTIVRGGNLKGAAPELSVRWEGRWKDREVENRRSIGGHLDPRLWGLYLQKSRFRHADT